MKLVIREDKKHTQNIKRMAEIYAIYAILDPLHVCGNAANLEDRTIRFFYMRIDLNSQKRKFILFCPPDWLHSHDVQGVYSVGALQFNPQTNTTYLSLILNVCAFSFHSVGVGIS